MFDWFHNRVPYTDYQQKNLDWLTETVREGEAAVEAKIEEADTAIDNAEAATEAANTAKTGADTAAASANAAATAANNAKDAANTAAANAQAAADKWATPYASTTVVGMTDHAKIYVYTGTEVGYTAGNWYYWNGTAWTSGGVYVGDISDAVLFSTAQSKTDAEKAQARTNAGAADVSVMKGTYYKSLTPVSTITSRRATASGAVVYLTSDSGGTVKAYPVKSGDVLLIRSFGYDASDFEVAAVGSGLVGGGESTPKLQVIQCGGSTYPTDYTNHVLKITISYDGYLYINQRNSTGVSSFASVHTESPIYDHGLYKESNTYYHFVHVADDKYLIRRFNRRGPNNLFQLTNVSLGYVVDGVGCVMDKSYTGEIQTDILGPFSMKKSGTAGGGVWAGGNHSVNVGGNDYPTAEQASLSVTMNGSAVSTDGLYFGDARIIAKNNIYYAQSITGNTFDDAELALEETREYDLTDTLRVSVTAETKEDTYFAGYYGMQYVLSNATKACVPDDEYATALPVGSDYVITNKSSEINFSYSDGSSVYMIVDPVGLGTFNENAGTSATLGYGVIAGYGKIYHTLIVDKTVASGKHLYWCGEYRQIV